jgi:hypothetical protein
VPREPGGDPDPDGNDLAVPTHAPVSPGSPEGRL